MDIFKNELLVEGKVIGGKIVKGVFHMNKLNPSNALTIPMPTKAFNKEWLDIMINELKAVRDNL